MSWADDYVDVATRLAAAFEKWPDLRIVEDPPQLREVADRLFLEVRVHVWRTADDPIPCVAHAWEPFPGRTPFTKDSEMMVGSTSALGRALAFMGLAGRKSIASADEVRAAKERQTPQKPAQNADTPSPTPKADGWYRAQRELAGNHGDGSLEMEYQERKNAERAERAKETQPPSPAPNPSTGRPPTPKQTAMFRVLIAKLNVPLADYPHATAAETSRSIDALKALEARRDRPDADWLAAEPDPF